MTPLNERTWHKWIQFYLPQWDWTGLNICASSVLVSGQKGANLYPIAAKLYCLLEGVPKVGRVRGMELWPPVQVVAVHSVHALCTFCSSFVLISECFPPLCDNVFLLKQQQSASSRTKRASKSSSQIHINYKLGNKHFPRTSQGPDSSMCRRESKGPAAWLRGVGWQAVWLQIEQSGIWTPKMYVWLKDRLLFMIGWAWLHFPFWSPSGGAIEQQGLTKVLKALLQVDRKTKGFISYFLNQWIKWCS